MTVHNIEELIQRQFRQWELYRKMRRDPDRDEPPPPRPVITISRELGAGARVLAHELAQRLDLQIHGISLIDQIARDKNLERRFVDQLDENTCSRIDLWVQGILNRRLFMHDEYHLALAKTVRMLSANGGVVIIGRGANVILSDTASLRIRVTAGMPTRIANVMRYEKVDAATAEGLIADSDRNRRAFMQTAFQIDPDDPRQYDLSLNTDRFEPSLLVIVVMAALESGRCFPGEE